MNLIDRVQQLPRPATFADQMADASVVNDLAKVLTHVAERLKADLDGATEAALASDYPAPTIGARQFAATVQNVLVLKAFTSPSVDLYELDVDVFAAQNGGVILTVDYKTKRLTFRIDPSGKNASVSEIGRQGYEDRVLIEGAPGIVPLFTWLVRPN